MVLNDFFKVRIELYDRRKLFLISKLSEEWEILDNKVQISNLKQLRL